MKLHRCAVTRNESFVLKEMADITKDTKHEVGLDMCYNKRTKDWLPAKLCIGNDCELQMETGWCPDDYEPIYEVHTHPSQEADAFSYDDIRTAYHYKYKRSCIITANTDRMTCIDIQNMKREGITIRALKKLDDLGEALADIRAAKRERERPFPNEDARYDFMDVVKADFIARELPKFIGEHNVCYYDLR